MKQNFLFDRVLPKIAAFGTVLAAVGLGLKCTQQTGGDILLVLGLSILALAYFISVAAPARRPGAVPTAAQATPTAPVWPDLVPRLASIGASFVCIGALFKLLSWPGATMQLLTGLVPLGLAGLLLALAGRLTRWFALPLALGLGLLALPQETLIRQFHRDDPVLTQLLLYRLHHPHDRAADAAVQQYWRARRK